MEIKQLEQTLCSDKRKRSKQRKVARIKETLPWKKQGYKIQDVQVFETRLGRQAVAGTTCACKHTHEVGEKHILSVITTCTIIYRSNYYIK